jgi:phage host-nuclease inhibitor protein Gam
MRDPLSLEFIGSLMRSVQAEQRTIRAELASCRQEIRSLESAVGDRIGAMEARLETRIDEFQSEMSQALAEIVRILKGAPPPAA